jgi:hypothetical protein
MNSSNMFGNFICSFELQPVYLYLAAGFPQIIALASYMSLRRRRFGPTAIVVAMVVGVGGLQVVVSIALPQLLPRRRVQR